MKVKTSRRLFVRCAIDDLISLVENLHGRRSFKLSGLGELSSEELGRLVPALIDVSNVVADDHDYFVLDADGHRQILFGIGSREEEVWSRIDGQASIRQIADALASQWSEDADAAFDRVRQVFLDLASKQICLPRNPLE